MEPLEVEQLVSPSVNLVAAEIDPPQSLYTWAFHTVQQASSCSEIGQAVTKAFFILFLQVTAGVLFLGKMTSAHDLDGQNFNSFATTAAPELDPSTRGYFGGVLMLFFVMSMVQDDQETLLCISSYTAKSKEQRTCYGAVVFHFVLYLRWVLLPVIIAVPTAWKLALSDEADMVLNSVATTFLLELDNSFYEALLSPQERTKYMTEAKYKVPPLDKVVWWTSLLTIWGPLCLVYWNAIEHTNDSTMWGLISLIVTRSFTGQAVVWACETTEPSFVSKVWNVIWMVFSITWQVLGFYSVLILAFSLFNP